MAGHADSPEAWLDSGFSVTVDLAVTDGRTATPSCVADSGTICDRVRGLG